MPSEIIYHLQPKVAGLSDIHVVGVAHGIPGILTMPRADENYLNDVVGRENADLLAEGLTDRLLRPRGVFAKRLEPTWMKDTQAMKNVVSSRSKLFGQDPFSWPKGSFGKNVYANAARLARRFAGPLALRVWSARRKPVVVTVPMSEREERQRLEDGARHSGLSFSDHVTALSVRSLFMTAGLIAHARESERSTVASCGAMHAGQIHRFLENPQTALAYLDELRSRKAGEFGHVLDGFEERHFAEAEKQFRHLLSLKARAERAS